MEPSLEFSTQRARHARGEKRGLLAPYSFFGARGIGTNGASTRVFIKSIPILMASLKTRVVSDLKTHIVCVPDGDFFDNWDIDRLLLSLAVRKKIMKFYTYINVIRGKNENCEFL